MNNNNKISIEPIRAPKEEINYVVLEKGGYQKIIKSLGEVNHLINVKQIPNLPKSVHCLPSNCSVDDVSDVSFLFAKIKELVSQVFYFKDESKLDLVCQYILSTWVFDQYSTIIYLSFVGYPGSGKSLLLNLLFHLCYNSFYMSGLASDSSFFRMANYNGTVLMDESQQSSHDSSSFFHKILAVSNQKMGNVTRAVQKGNSKDFTLEVFTPFGPKIFSGRGIPGDDAILSRTHSIQLQAISLEKQELLKDVLNPEWQNAAEKMRNDLLLYRQKRVVGDLLAPNINYKDLLPKNFTTRNSDVYKWLLMEAPNQEILKSIIIEVRRNLDSIKKRRGTHLEPAILLACFDLLIIRNGRRVFLKDISIEVNTQIGIFPTPRQVSFILDQNGIETMKARENGRYILTNADQIAEKLVVLGFDDPRLPDTSDTVDTDCDQSNDCEVDL